MMNTMKTRTYSELIKLNTFEERFDYLKLDGVVGQETFGNNRILNQILYKDPEWRRTRRDIIARDNGCDLGIEGREIYGPITVHHIEPITLEDVIKRAPKVFDPENLISSSDLTHKAVHYSNDEILPKDPIERKANDTCPWKK